MSVAPLKFRPRSSSKKQNSRARRLLLEEQYPTVIVHDEELLPGLTALCAGYELGQWRAKALAKRLMEWMLEFCLAHSDLEGLSPQTAIPLVRKAASLLYTTEKFKNRGEFGELLLHAAMRLVYDTKPAISKIYYKDSANDTVKGFDAVHIVANRNQLELWLGEAKFFDNINRAISDVATEIELHTRRDYLRSEFVAIKNKIDDRWPYADRLRQLLHDHTSLDLIFDAVCIPVLLTYDSKTVARHNRQTEEYRMDIEHEVRNFHSLFASKGLQRRLNIHLFLVPLNTKSILINELDRELRAWQEI